MLVREARYRACDAASVGKAHEWRPSGTARQRNPAKGPLTPEERAARLREVAAYFLRLGFTAFGGPAAHVAMMRDEVVRRRKWVSDQRFLDLLGVINLIPGPNSTELAIYLGYERAGWLGLVAAGLALHRACHADRAGAGVGLRLVWCSAEIGWLLYGIKPVVIAIILQALWGLARTALKGTAPRRYLALAVATLYLLNALTLWRCSLAGRCSMGWWSWRGGAGARGAAGRRR